MPELASLRSPADAPLRPVRGAAVAGLGTALPQTVVSNAEIAARIGVEPDWILQRTGIRERRVCAPGEGLTDLATRAARSALEDSEIDPLDVDLVLVATATADDVTPGASPLVASAIGAVNAGAIDVGAACTGFLAGLALGSAYIEAGRARTVVLVGADVLHRYCDPADRRTAALFGDGAGAVVLTATGEAVMGPVVLGSDAQRELLYAARDEHLIRMEGQEVFKHAVARMTAATHAALDAAGAQLDDVDCFVYHQANSRITRSIGQRLGLDPAKVVDCIDGYGNTSGASIPLALGHARANGMLAPGAKVLVGAFGAGFTWGATLLTWGNA